MAIRGDSFSSVTEVVSFTRHLLDGQSAFNSTTRPTLTDVEKFIDRASGVLNVAIASSGFAPSAVYANSTAKLACDDWVTQQAAKYVELTQRGTGYNAQEGSRTAAFNLNGKAKEHIKELLSGWIYLGITQANRMGEGLAYTGLDAQDQRDDPDDTTREQPLFTRRKFDNP